MLAEFEKSTCATVVKGLKAKLLRVVNNDVNKSKFKTVPETYTAIVLASLLVCSYMKTFNNQDTKDFLKSIKNFCEAWSSTHNPRALHSVHMQINSIMSEQFLTARNKPLIELLYGETITVENEVHGVPYTAELGNKLSLERSSGSSWRWNLEYCVYYVWKIQRLIT